MEVKFVWVLVDVTKRGSWQSELQKDGKVLLKFILGKLIVLWEVMPGVFFVVVVTFGVAVEEC